VACIGRQARSQLRVAVGALLPDGRDGRSDGFVAGTGTQQAAQVVALGCKKTEVELAFGGQAGAVAVAAECLGDAADHADFALQRVVLTVRIGVAPAFGRFAK